MATNKKGGNKMIDEVSINLIWSTRTTKSGNKQVYAYSDMSERPVLYFLGKQAAVGNFSGIRGAGNIKIFNMGLDEFLEDVYESSLDIQTEVTFKLRSQRPGRTWTHMSYDVEIGDNTFLIAGFSVGDLPSGLVVNGPQWKIETDTGNVFRPIIVGKVVEMLKSLAEANYRSHVDVAELDHNARCTKCSWFTSTGYDRSDHLSEGITYSCLLNKFVPFNSCDISVEMRERCNVTEDWRSMDADAEYDWLPDDVLVDTPLSLDDWIRIGVVIDSKAGTSFERRFSNFARMYDDVMWIDRIAKKYGWDAVSDLDAAITDIRDSFIRKAMRHWAAVMPDYSYLFLNESGEHTSDVTIANGRLSVKKVSQSRFIEDFIVRPCGLCNELRQNKKGDWHTYRSAHLDIPEHPVHVFNSFALSIGLEIKEY